MRFFFQTIAFGFLLLTLASCSFQKRAYLPGYYIPSPAEVRESNKKGSNECDVMQMSNNSTFTNVSLKNKNSLPDQINNPVTCPEAKSSRSDMLIKTVILKNLILNEKGALKIIKEGIIKNKVLEKRNRISIPTQDFKQTDNTEKKPISKWQMLLLFCIVCLLLAFLGWGITGLLTGLLILGSVLVLAFLILILILGSIGDSAWG